MARIDPDRELCDYHAAFNIQNSSRTVPGDCGSYDWPDRNAHRGCSWIPLQERRMRKKRVMAIKRAATRKSLEFPPEQRYVIFKMFYSAMKRAWKDGC